MKSGWAAEDLLAWGECRFMRRRNNKISLRSLSSSTFKNLKNPTVEVSMNSNSCIFEQAVDIHPAGQPHHVDIGQCWGSFLEAELCRHSSGYWDAAYDEVSFPASCGMEDGCGPSHLSINGASRKGWPIRGQYFTGAAEI